MSRLIDTIEGEPITENDDGSVSWRGKFAVDTDGSGPLHGDPCAQRDTSLHVDGNPLNADVDRYIVVPPAILNGVKGIVLGCRAFVRNTRNGLNCFAVVGDIGPRRKLGEGSVATAREIGINPSPTSGGMDEHIVEWKIWPGVAAVLDGKIYPLQPAR